MTQATLTNITKHPVYKAMHRTPMADTKQVDLAIQSHLAFESIVCGQGKLHDLEVLASTANVALVLAEQGYGPECEIKIKDAAQAVLRAHTRAGKHSGRIGFDGPGAQAIRDLIDIHTQQLAAASQADVIDALHTVQARIKAGKVERSAV